MKTERTEEKLCEMLSELAESHYINDRQLLQSTIDDFDDTKQLYDTVFEVKK